MQHFEQSFINQLRAANNFVIDLSDQAKEELHLRIRSDTFVPARLWQTQYVRLLLESHWLGGLLATNDHTTQEFLIFAVRRASTLKAIESLEIANNLRVNARPSQRWTTEDQSFLDRKALAESCWIDDLKEDLRTAAATELHWLNTLRRHGHGKFAPACALFVS